MTSSNTHSPSDKVGMLQLQKLMLKNGIKRGRKMAGLLQTMAGGYRAATRIGAWQSPPRDILPKYIQAFCSHLTQAMGVKVVQVEPVPQTLALWASNHVSWVDIAVMGSVSPAFFLSKAEVEQMPVFGRLARAAGTLFIKRGSGDSASVSVQIADFLRRGYSVIFYPEGTTTDGKHIKKIYGKLLQAAIDADQPIQPTVLCYVNRAGELDDQIPYYGNMTMKESLKRVFDSEGVTAYVLPLEQIHPNGRSRDELTQLLQTRMEEGLARLHATVVRSPQ